MKHMVSQSRYMQVSRAFYQRLYNIALMGILVGIHKMSVKCRIPHYLRELYIGVSLYIKKSNQNKKIII